MKVKLCTTILFLSTQLMFSQWIQLGTDIDGETANDNSGFSVSLNNDGTVVAIGAPLNDGNGIDSGHVRVYQYDGVSWTQLGSDIDGEAASDESGQSISLSNNGTILAIGAPLNDDNGIDSGHVRVYQYDGIDWIQLGQDIDGEAAEDQSGTSISLSADGTTVAIGAPLNDGNGIDSGHVRVYEWDGISWSQLGQDIDGEAAGDNSGFSVSLDNDGTTMAIGAPLNDWNGIDSGRVRLHFFSGGNWFPSNFFFDGEAAGDQFGFSVSIGTLVGGGIMSMIIGAPLNDGNGVDSGHVRIFMNSKGGWGQVGQDIDGENSGDQSGRWVSLSDDYNFDYIFAIGAALNSDNGLDSGQTRVYGHTGNPYSPNWDQISGDINGETIGDNFGQSVSLSGDGTILAIGAPLNDGNGIDSGHVRIYTSPVLSTPPTEHPNTILTLHTNPVRELLSIDLTTGLELKILYLYDVQGKKVAISKTSSLDVNHLNNGIYFAVVQLSDGKTVVKKAIISRD